MYTAWVGSLGYGFLFVIGPITTALCEQLGCRVMACTGSVLTTFSLLLTSFAPNISSMYFTFGVLWGTGGSFLFFSGLLILRFYFNRNISLANGITMTGAGFGTLVFNVMLQELDEEYGWRGGMRVLSVFAALTFLCGCAYIPPPADYLPFERPSLWFRLKRLIDPRPWKEKAFTMWVLSLSFILFAYFFPYTYLVRMAMTLGVPVSQGALLLGYLSISAIFGKLLCGRLADLPRVRCLYIFVISATILSLSSMCVTAAKSYHGLLAYTLVAGFFDGCFVVTVPLITQDIVGKDLMAKALGSLYGVVAFPLTLGPPVLGELYKSTDSFKTAFFVSSGFVLVGVSLIYIVQRIRPDLIHKQEPSRQEVYDSSVMPSPSIHSASVVDTLSGMFVTEQGLSASHLDPMEIGSYQRFDSFRREDSRATLSEPFHGRRANQTEIEAVYRHAVDNLSNISEVTGHHREGSDTSDIPKANVPEQSHTSSVFSGSMLSSSEMPLENVDSPTGLQNALEATDDLPKASESGATLVGANMGESLHVDEGGISIPGDGIMIQEGDQQELATGPAVGTQTVLEVGGSEKPESDDFDLSTKIQPLQVGLENEELISPEPMITENRDMELGVELVKLPPPSESDHKRRTGPPESSNEESDTVSFSGTDDFGNDVVKTLIPKTKEVDSDEHTFQDSDGSTTITLFMTGPPEKEENMELQVVNEVLEMVRIPPPPVIPRTGQLVALESDTTEDRKNTSPCEVKLNTDQDDLYEKEVADDNSSCRDVSIAQRKERLHLAIIDQLNLLSERLEAVAARQSEEEDYGDGDKPDQRPPFSPALQSLPLTPRYSANQSVPLTPVRSWSSFLNTPAPTPRQTPPSAFHTTAPTPIHTPLTPAQGVSGICTPSDVSGANPSRSNVYETEQMNFHDSTNWDDIIDVCSSPSPSQDAVSRHRSRSSSTSEFGQEFVLNEWSIREPHGSTEAFSSKPSSGTNSLVSNSARSLADLNSVSEPIDVVDITINGSHRGHMNSPEKYSPTQQLEPSVGMCLPPKPYVQNENTDASGENPFSQPCLDFNTTELQTNPLNDSSQMVATNFFQTLAQEVPQDVPREEHLYGDVSHPQITYQQFSTSDPKENYDESAGPNELKSDTAFIYCEPKLASIPQPEDFSNTSPASKQQKKSEFIADSSELQIQKSCFDPSPLDSKLNPFLESDKNEFSEITQHHPFQKSPDGLPVRSPNPFQIPSEIISQDEHLLSVYQPKGLPIVKEHCTTEQIEASLSQSRSLTRISPELKTSPQATESYFQPNCTDNLVEQQAVSQQINFAEEDSQRSSEESETVVSDHTFTSSDDTEQETEQQLSNQSTWTMFSQSKEVLIFEMDTESESSSDSAVKHEKNSSSSSRDSKTGNEVCFTADQEDLFPPLQIFSDIIDIPTSSSQGIPLKLPPPPRQTHRKRTDVSDLPKTGHALPNTIGGKDGESKQISLVDKHIFKETVLPPEAKLVDEHRGSLRQLKGGNVVDTHPVSSDGDFSATGNSVSEIESDLLSESKIDELTQKLSDNSISVTVCQEFESIKDEDETFTGEEADDSNLDGEMAKISFHDDFAPLLVQKDEPIQYVNLRDLPEDCHVLQKRPSTTSSTDDSSTSTDSSLSENEMPYSKLHEDTAEQG
ncbi:hypothetical protein ACROYT_G009122 [Oculina patagonica]